MPAVAPSLKGRALRLLAAREHSRAELERKLRPVAKELGQLDQLGPILDDLAARDFINAGRVAESLLNRRAAKLGAARLRQELNQKGLGREDVDLAMQSLQSTELDRARQVRLKKFGDAAPKGQEAARQMRFLLTRGFSADIVRKALLGGAPLEEEAGTDAAPDSDRYMV